MRLEEGTVVGREVHGSSNVVVATVVGLVMDGGVVGRGVVVATAHEVGLVLGEGVYDQTACHMTVLKSLIHRGPCHELVSRINPCF